MKPKKNNVSATPAPKSGAPKNQPSRPFLEELKSFLNNRYLHYFLLLVIGIIFYVNYNAMFDKKLDMNGDNIVYYSLGKSLHEGTGYSNILGFDITPHTHFPPGYPAFISVLLNFVDNGSFTPIKNANGVLLCLSIFLLFFIIKRFTRNNVPLALTAAILFCVQKDLLRWSTIMMSEMLFLFLTVLIIFCALQLYQKKSFKEYTVREYVALALMVLSIAYTYFVRTMGLSLILGLVGWLGGLALYEWYKYRKEDKSPETTSAFRQKLCYYGCLVGIVMMPFIISKVAWDCRNRSIGHEQTDYIGDFHKKGGNGEVMTTWSDWTERIYNNSKNYLTKFMPETITSKPFDVKEPNTSGDIITGFAIFVLVIIGFLGLGSGGFLLFCYLFVTFCVLLVWPEQFSSVRYYVAIVPFLLFLFMHGFYNIFHFLLGKVKKEGILKYRSVLATMATIILTFFWLIPTQAEAQEPYRNMAKYSYKKISDDQNYLNFFEALDWCKENLSDSARMICRKPELYYMYSGFKKSVSFPYYAEVDTVMSYINKVKATHLIMDNWFKHAYVTLYPAVKKYPDQFKVIHKIGEADSVKKTNPVYIIEYNPEWGYHGELVDGKKEGKGSYIYQDGRKYIGFFKNDLPNGEGEFYNSEGTLQFKGTWKDGNYLTGKGFSYYNGKKYEGEFKNGSPNGYGVYSDSTGHVIAKGIWRNGTLVEMQ